MTNTLTIQTANNQIKRYKNDPDFYSDYIEALEFKIEYMANILAKIWPEQSGHYFICGEAGTKDRNGLPEFLHICPTYGADFKTTVVYKKI